MNRLEFLKNLGLGVVGTGVAATGAISISDVDKVFTPDIQQEIENLKQRILNKVNPEVSTYTVKHEIRTEVRNLKETHFMGSKVELNSAMWIAQGSIDKWFNQRHRKYECTEPEKIQEAIDFLIEYYNDPRCSKGNNTTFYCESIAKGYIILNQLEEAAIWFGKTSGIGVKREYKKYFELRGHKAPKITYINSANKISDKVFDFRKKHKMGMVTGGGIKITIPQGLDVEIDSFKESIKNLAS